LDGSPSDPDRGEAQVSSDARVSDQLRSTAVVFDLAVVTPAFLDLTFVGLEDMPAPGEERYAGDLLRSPGGGAITAVAAARLGLRTGLVAPLGTDLAGEFVRREVEKDGVAVIGPRPRRTPQTMVMPVGEQRSMVTIDPGARASADDLADLTLSGLATNVEQLGLVPHGARAYVTCGDDDARAFARRLPASLRDARVLVLADAEALVVTGTDSVEAAIAALAGSAETVIVTQGAHGAIATVDGRRVDVPDFDARPAVDTTGDRDLLCAAYAWADLGGADPTSCLAWAQLYSQLAMDRPTATGGAVAEARLLEEGKRHGLVPPPRNRS
jgi:sugar/nucleoside kinase (ribokinase family)